MLHPEVSSFVEDHLNPHPNELLAFSSKNSYQAIENDQTPHTAYYVPNGGSTGKKKKKVATDRKQAAPIVNKQYKDMQ